MAGCFRENTVRLWPRERLIQKIESMCKDCQVTWRCPSGTASKIEGCMNFASTGMYGRIGRGGLPALRARAHAKTRFPALTPRLDALFTYIPLLLKACPYRLFQLAPKSTPPLVIASDAAAEPGQPLTMGVLIVDLVTNSPI